MIFLMALVLFRIYKQNGVKELLNAEEKYLENLQQAPSRIHNALRNVGNFPFIITTNMDELLERFLWKTGNGGEKIRLDQVSRIYVLSSPQVTHLVFTMFSFTCSLHISNLINLFGGFSGK